MFASVNESQSASLAQSLHLINASDIRAKLATAGGTAERLADDARPLAEKIADLYRLAFSRDPTTEELQTAESYFAEPRLDAEWQADRSQASGQREFPRLAVGHDQYQRVPVQPLAHVAKPRRYSPIECVRRRAECQVRRDRLISEAGRKAARTNTICLGIR